MIDTKTRLEEINKELESGKLSDHELDALLDEVQEISAKERKNLDELLKSYKAKLGWKFWLKGSLIMLAIVTVAIHTVKLVWYFITFNWNLW